MKVKINNRKTFNYLLILVFGMILSIPLLSKNLNIYNNQGFYCLAKGFEYTKNFSSNEGKILTSFLNYIGTGNTILEAPLGTLIFFVGNYIFDSYIFTYKLVVFCSILLSGLYMHKFIDKVLQNKDISLMASFIYMSLPIHLGQIYLNNSIESILVFVFIPITFFGLYKLFNTTENNFHLAFGYIGLILTDLRFAIIVSFAVLVYFIINFKNWPLEHVRKYFVINLVAIISITAFFVFPFIQSNMMAEYVGSNSLKEIFLNSRVSLKSLFVTEENDITVLELGPHIIIMLALSIFSFHKYTDEEKKEYIFCFSMMVFYILMSTKIFPWGIFPNCISRLENPYIFLIVAAFFESVVCAMNVGVVIKKFNLKHIFVITIFVLIYLFLVRERIPYTDTVFDIDSYDMSEIISYNVLPQKAKNNIEYIRNRSRDVEVLEGNAEILEKNKFLTYYSFKANTLEKNTVYELPFLYYPGYEIRYDGITLDYFESENGMIAFKMTPEKDTHFEVEFVGTNLMNFCKILSFISLIVFSIYVYKKR